MNEIPPLPTTASILRINNFIESIEFDSNLTFEGRFLDFKVVLKMKPTETKFDISHYKEMQQDLGAESASDVTVRSRFPNGTDVKFLLDMLAEYLDTRMDRVAEHLGLLTKKDFGMFCYNEGKIEYHSVSSTHDDDYYIGYLAISEERLHG